MGDVGSGLATAALVLALWVAGWWALVRAARWAARGRPDPMVDALIEKARARRYRFAGFDPAARARTQRQRQQAATRRAQAARLDTRPAEETTVVPFEGSARW